MTWILKDVVKQEVPGFVLCSILFCQFIGYITMDGWMMYCEGRGRRYFSNCFMVVLQGLPGIAEVVTKTSAMIADFQAEM
jgi:hypothetical protein